MSAETIEVLNAEQHDAQRRADDGAALKRMMFEVASASDLFAEIHGSKAHSYAADIVRQIGIFAEHSRGPEHFLALVKCVVEFAAEYQAKAEGK